MFMKQLFASKTKEDTLSDWRSSATFILIDVSNLAYRAASANPFAKLTTKTGIRSGHIFGMVTMLISILKKMSSGSTTLVLGYDDVPTHKLKIFKKYKHNRHKYKKNSTSPLAISAYSNFFSKGKKSNKSDFLRLFEKIPHLSIKAKGHECDDVIASFIKAYRTTENRMIIVSNDRDMWQLLRRNVFCYSGQELVTNSSIQQNFKTPEPRQIPLIKAVFGDSSDGIPPVIKTRKKAKRNLVRRLIGKSKGQLKAFLSKLTDHPELFNRKKLTLIKRNFKIIKLRKNIRIKIKTKPGNKTDLEKYLLRFECKSLIPKLSVFF